MIPSLLPDGNPMMHRRMPRFDYVDDAEEIAQTLISSMQYYEGAGLAANQIGIECAAFAMRTSWVGPIVLFNPLVTWLSTEMVAIEEGCLSFPGLDLKIKRPKACQVQYQSVDESTHVLNLSGDDARIALHEMDHLLGIVFTEKVSRLKLTMAKKKSKKA